MPGTTEAECVNEQSKARLNRDDFGDLYSRTAPALKSYICRVAGSANVADDILQEAYIHLLRAPPLDDAQRKSYLYRTATNLIVDHWRARNRERNWMERLVQRQPGTLLDIGLPTDLERLFALLNVRERALLWLAYVEGADHGEIADVLHIGEKSVRVLLFRARRKMEEILRKHGFRAEASR
jgi:RNA polymerase sigma-70 factor (ECF subfamily)